MENKIVLRLGRMKKSLLATCAVAAFAAPLALGLGSPQAIAQGTDAAGAPPSPGTEAALRRQIEGWEKKQPVLEDLTPGMAKQARQTQEATQKQIDAWGPLKFITFKGVEYGVDYYQVEFQHGVSLWSVLPLEEGKVDGLYIEEPIARSDNGPSAGVESALRRNYAALLKGAPDYDLMSPRLITATKRQSPFQGQDVQVQDAKNLGVLNSISFVKVTPQGSDLYSAVYSNGTATWEVKPLVKGKLNVLSWSHIILPRAPQHPGTDVALRHHIESLQKDRPNYDEMTPEFAALQRPNIKGFEDEIRPWGALRAITYKGGGTRGSDSYDVTFEHAKVQWIIMPLTADGKTVNLRCGDITLIGPQSLQE